MDEIKNKVLVDEVDHAIIWKKQVASSLYNYIYELDPNLWKEIEVEAKLGKVLFQGKCEEKYSKVLNPFVISGKFRNCKDNFITFDPCLSKENFFILFEKISKEFENKTNKITGPIKSCDYDGNGFRKSIINNNVVEVLKKMNKHNYDIRNDGNDIRVSISREKRFNNDKEIKLSGFMREKHRISFYYDNFVIDFTIVNSYINKVLKSTKFEVELEFYKIRENALNYKGNFKEFEKVIFQFCYKIENYYSILKENRIENEEIINLLKKFNFEI